MAPPTCFHVLVKALKRARAGVRPLNLYRIHEHVNVKRDPLHVKRGRLHVKRDPLNLYRIHEHVNTHIHLPARGRPAEVCMCRSLLRAVRATQKEKTDTKHSKTFFIWVACLTKVLYQIFPVSSITAKRCKLVPHSDLSAVPA